MWHFHSEGKLLSVDTKIFGYETETDKPKEKLACLLMGVCFDCSGSHWSAQILRVGTPHWTMSQFASKEKFHVVLYPFDVVCTCGFFWRIHPSRCSQHRLG